MKKFNKVILIPARSGSKRLIHKNIKKIGGKPLIYYSIKQALKIKNIDQEDTNLIRKIRGSLELSKVLTTKEILEKARIRYEPTLEEYHLYKNRNIITERYNDLLDKRNGRNGKMVGKTLRECDSSINTYFMKQYIEATHNMFLIQQKRIDELERKINVS